MNRILHDGRDDGLEPVESLDVRGADGTSDLLRRMSRTAFGGRALGEAFEVLSAMAEDPKCTIVVTVSGAMTARTDTESAGGVMGDVIGDSFFSAFGA